VEDDLVSGDGVADVVLDLAEDAFELEVAERLDASTLVADGSRTRYTLAIPTCFPSARSLSKISIAVRQQCSRPSSSMIARLAPPLRKPSACRRAMASSVQPGVCTASA
jgi:hypothetical protein